MKVTILTPTYNRKHTLERLYESLLRQTSKDFEWLIIDDGSTDNTNELIQKYIDDNKVNIRYFYKNNGGKHRALNYGIKKIKNELTFFVDSDDWIEKDAIETIIKYGKKYKDNKKIGALSFLKAYPNKSINGPKYMKNEYVGNYINDRLNNHNWGDKAEVCFTKKLKEFPFLEIPNEKFLAEGYVWVNMALKYDMVFINKVIYIADYLEDGMTKNIYNIRVKNPLGCIEVAKISCNKKANLEVKFKNIIKYITYSKFANIKFKQQLNHINYKLLFLILYIPSNIFYLYVKNKVKNI